MATRAVIFGHYPNYCTVLQCNVFDTSVHLRMSEKLNLVAGRDGGLQNMEVLGIISLRISDPECGKIRLLLANNEKRSVQFQVGISELTFGEIKHSWSQTVWLRKLAACACVRGL